jgi:hypothetical protein
MGSANSSTPGPVIRAVNPATPIFRRSKSGRPSASEVASETPLFSEYQQTPPSALSASIPRLLRKEGSTMSIR